MITSARFIAAHALAVALLAPTSLRAQQFEIMEATVASGHQALDSKRLTC